MTDHLKDVLTEHPEKDLKDFSDEMEILTEDAEIEAELEAEKKIRSKNTRILTIALIGAVLLFFLYYFVLQRGTEEESPVAGLDTPLPADLVKDLLPKKEPVPSQPAETEEAASSASPEPTQEKVPAEEPAAAPAPAPVETAAAPEKSAEPAPAPAEKPAARENTPAAPPKPETPPAQAKAPAPATEKQPKPVEVASAPPAVPTPTAGNYFVQIGAFSVQSNADNISKKLKSKGFPLANRVKSLNLPRHVVTVGLYFSKKTAEDHIKDLKDKGFKATPIQNQDETYSLLAGQFKDEKRASALQDELSLKGFLSSVRKTRVDTSTYIVRVGGYGTRDEAVQAQKKLARQGFKNTLVIR